MVPAICHLYIYQIIGTNLHAKNWLFLNISIPKRAILG